MPLELLVLVGSYVVIKDNAFAQHFAKVRSVLQVPSPGPKHFNGENRIWYNGPDLMRGFIRV